MKRLINILFPAILISLLFSCSNDGKKVDLEVGISERKFNPGHYVAVGAGFNLTRIKYFDEPAVIGVNKRYNWRVLEPEKDEYDLSSIENDLKYCEKHNKHLVVFLIDRSFWIKGAMPAYLSEYELEADGGGFSPLRWYPEVKDRFIKLAAEIGNRYDNNPYFEGIALQESSLDLKEEDYKKYSYTVEKYCDAMIDILTNFQNAMPKSHIFWYGNFIPQDDGTSIRKIYDKMAPYGVYAGGPDILPYHKGYNRYSYPLFEEFKDKLIFFSSAQDDSYKTHKNDYSHEVEEEMPDEGYMSMEDVFLFGRDKLHLRYIFWNYFYEAEKEGQHTYEDAIKVIRKYPAFNEDIMPYK